MKHFINAQWCKLFTVLLVATFSISAFAETKPLPNDTVQFYKLTDVIQAAKDWSGANLAQTAKPCGHKSMYETLNTAIEAASAVTKPWVIVYGGAATYQTTRETLEAAMATAEADLKAWNEAKAKLDEEIAAAQAFVDATGTVEDWNNVPEDAHAYNEQIPGFIKDYLKPAIEAQKAALVYDNDKDEAFLIDAYTTLNAKFSDVVAYEEDCARVKGKLQDYQENAVKVIANMVQADLKKEAQDLLDSTYPYLTYDRLDPKSSEAEICAAYALLDMDDPSSKLYELDDKDFLRTVEALETYVVTATSDLLKEFTGEDYNTFKHEINAAEGFLLHAGDYKEQDRAELAKQLSDLIECYWTLKNMSKEYIEYANEDAQVTNWATIVFGDGYTALVQPLKDLQAASNAAVAGLDNTLTAPAADKAKYAEETAKLHKALEDAMADLAEHVKQKGKLDDKIAEANDVMTDFIADAVVQKAFQKAIDAADAIANETDKVYLDKTTQELIDAIADLQKAINKAKYDQAALEIADGVDYTRTTEYDGIPKTSYARKLTKGVWAPFFVGFEFEVTEDFLKDYEIAGIYSVNGDLGFTINFQTLAKGVRTHANQPYIIRAKNADSEAVEISNVKLTSVAAPVCDVDYLMTRLGNFGIKGAYRALDKPTFASYISAPVEELLIFSKDGTIGYWDVDHATTGLKASRWFMTFESKPDPYLVKFFVDGMDITGTTGLKSIETENVQGGMFDLSGRKVATPKAGQIYIQNGKKVMF